MKRILMFVIVLVAILAFATPAFAQGEQPPVPQTSAELAEEDIAQLIAFTVLITGFFKQQFGLQGKGILGAGFVVILVLGFLPDIQALFPNGAYLIDKFVLIVKVFLSSAGLFDVAVNIGAKIATATVTKSGELSTSKAD